MFLCHHPPGSSLALLCWPSAVSPVARWAESRSETQTHRGQRSETLWLTQYTCFQFKKRRENEAYGKRSIIMTGTYNLSIYLSCYSISHFPSVSIKSQHPLTVSALTAPHSSGRQDISFSPYSISISDRTPWSLGFMHSFPTRHHSFAGCRWINAVSSA